MPVVWGGSGPTLEPDLCIKDTDLVCVGEGEQAIVDLAGAVGSIAASLPKRPLQ